MNPIIRQIVNRCHVSMSNRAVIYYAVSRLKRKYQTFAGLSRTERKTFMQACITVHTENRALYARVMGGM